MRKFLPVVLIAALGLSGCGYVRDSRINPFNWFGPSSSRQATPQEAEAAANPLIPGRSAFARAPEEDLREPVAGLEALVVERIPGGAIIRATGVTALAGAYDVELLSQSDRGPIDGFEGGVARYVMVAYPREDAAPGPIQTRRVTAAARLSNAELAGVTSIEVVSASNVLTSRR